MGSTWRSRVRRGSGMLDALSLRAQWTISASGKCDLRGYACEGDVHSQSEGRYR